MRFLPAPRRVVPVLIVLVLLGSALSLVLALTRPDPQPPADLPGAGSQPYTATRLAGGAGPAVEAMVRALPVALSYDYRDLDADLADATALMTDGFAKAFTRSFNTSARPLAKRQRTVAEARVRGAGVVRVLDDDAVVALAYVDQVLTSRTEPKAEATESISRSRVLVRLVLEGETWLVSNISPV